MEIQNLLDFERLGSGGNLVAIVLYFPLGITLAVLRLFISLHALIISFILPNSWILKRVILRVMLAVIGVIITTEGDENRDGRARLMVCNHVSALDHLVTGLAFPHICIVDWHLSSFFRLITLFRKISPDKNKADVIEFVKSIYNETRLPLLFFPEKTTTNGKIGLLKYWSLPFDLGHIIQPVTIQASRVGIFQINLSTACSVWWKDYLWCLFSPYTILKLRYLPTTERKAVESHDEFSERVRQNMCKSLGVVSSTFSHTDKKDYLKKQSKPLPNHPSFAASVNHNTTHGDTAITAIQETEIASKAADFPTVDPKVKAMVEQVKLVLPHVPRKTILTELETSHDVDSAIANILEGNIEFTSEEIKVTLSPAQKMFKAKNFGPNASHRHMSLEERKNEMYELARQKYREKHML